MILLLGLIAVALVAFLSWELNSTIRELTRVEAERDALWDQLHRSEQ